MTFIVQKQSKALLPPGSALRALSLWYLRPQHCPSAGWVTFWARLSWWLR